MAGQSNRVRMNHFFNLLFKVFHNHESIRPGWNLPTSPMGAPVVLNFATVIFGHPDQFSVHSSPFFNLRLRYWTKLAG